MLEPNSADPLVVDARTAARMLAISERTLWSRTAPRGSIPVVAIGARRLYDVEDLRRYIAAQKVGGATQ